jgi:WhiB family transcriptional regulator, redox-sensing transcriptional regulator
MPSSSLTEHGDDAGDRGVFFGWRGGFWGGHDGKRSGRTAAVIHPAGGLTSACSVRWAVWRLSGTTCGMAHRQEPPPHGTRSRYVYWKCGCGLCRRAHADYQRAHRNDGTRRVPAREARRHLADLRSCQISLREIADASGLHRSTLDRLAAASDDTLIQSATAQAVLGVAIPTLDRRAAATAKRLSHLLDAGVPRSWLTQLLGSPRLLGGVVGPVTAEEAAVVERTFSDWLRRKFSDVESAGRTYPVAPPPPDVAARYLPSAGDDVDVFLQAFASILEHRVEQRWWHTDAACAGEDPAMFFPQRGESPAPALAVCARCPVRAQCLEANMSMVDGVVGGTTGKQRRQMRSTAAQKRTA